MLDPIDRSDMAARRDDVLRMVSIMAGQGDHVTPEAAYRAWLRNSETSAASWLMPDDDDELVLAQIRRSALEFQDLIKAAAA